MSATATTFGRIGLNERGTLSGSTAAGYATPDAALAAARESAEQHHKETSSKSEDANPVTWMRVMDVVNQRTIGAVEVPPHPRRIGPPSVQDRGNDRNVQRRAAENHKSDESAEVPFNVIYQGMSHLKNPEDRARVAKSILEPSRTPDLVDIAHALHNRVEIASLKVQGDGTVSITGKLKRPAA